MANSKLDALRKKAAANILDEEQLDAAAGGYSNTQESEDLEFFNSIGVGAATGDSSESRQLALTSMFSTFGITYNIAPGAGVPNTYHLDGKEISREEAYEHVTNHYSALRKHISDALQMAPKQ